MTVLESPTLPMILDEVEVRSVERLSRSFVRIELGGACLADFGVAGPTYDQRIKLVFPPASGRLPSCAGADAAWYAAWRDQPEDVRGHMRTYTVREVRGSGADTRLVVDFVLHLEPGAVGPGSAWAASARPGDRVVVLAPRAGVPFGGIEFAPPASARSVLLAADETAVPAVCSILEQLPAGLPAVAFLEVPHAEDVLDLDLPPGVEAVWLPRGAASYGDRLLPTVRRHLGLPATADLVDEGAVDPDLWETPSYSSSGEDLESPLVVGHDLDGLYAWIAGESRVVTTLRRCLVSEVEVDRRQVAFMGYWRRGVSMRS